jgi:hypothetical protein
MYPLDHKTNEDLVHRFTYHPPKENQVKRYGDLRSAGRLLAEQIAFLTPKSREQSLALTKLEEAIFWANASIARNE